MCSCMFACDFSNLVFSSFPVFEGLPLFPLSPQRSPSPGFFACAFRFGGCILFLCFVLCHFPHFPHFPFSHPHGFFSPIFLDFWIAIFSFSKLSPFFNVSQFPNPFTLFFLRFGGRAFSWLGGPSIPPSIKHASGISNIVSCAPQKKHATWDVIDQTLYTYPTLPSPLGWGDHLVTIRVLEHLLRPT